MPPGPIPTAAGEPEAPPSTRLILLSLPHHLTPSSLRAALSAPSSTPTASSSRTQPPPPSSAITDLKLYSGRHFAFVGYRTVDEAVRCKKWWDGAYLEGGRIKVEYVQDGVDKRPAKREKRARDDSNGGVASTSSAAETVVPKGASKRLKHSSALPSTSANAQPLGADAGKKRNRSEQQKDEFLELFSTKRASAADSGARTWEDAAPEVDMPAVAETAEEEAQDDSPTAADGGEAEEEMDDEAWARKFMTSNLVDEPAAKKAVEIVEAGSAARPEGADLEQDPKETILETGRLFLRNLAFSCSDADLRALMTPFGPLASIHIPLSQTHKPLGTAYVSFASAPHALAAFEALDGKAFQGRLLHILPGRARPGQKEGAGEALGFKGKQDQKKKDAAGAMGNGREWEWSWLFMNSDAVASSVADRMKIDKADILGADSSNAAVKLALAETHVIQETKDYLESEGVDLKLPSTTPRSPTTLLIKNIPYATGSAALASMLEPFGEVSRLLVPPSGTIALVEFKEEREAREAWKGLSYKRVGNSVLYLEKGPKGLWNGEVIDKKAPEPAASAAAPLSTVELPATAAKKTPKAAVASATTTKAADSEAVPPNATLFVKNLSFTTTPAGLLSLFSPLPGFAFARIQTKPQPTATNPTQRVSMGFGFAGFKTPAQAEAAMKVAQGKVIDGRALEIGFAKRNTEDVEVGSTADKKGGKKGWMETTTKMVVKNLPFEASKKDVQELFGSFAPLKSVRLPKKFNAGSRGFAFLDFHTRREAESVMASLKHTHLLGRHLVLEWAKEGEDVDKLREQAGDVVRAGEEGAGEKRGKRTKIVL